jgi:septal ring factor EnvC (AmiA/AmiB activator)
LSILWIYLHTNSHGFLHTLDRLNNKEKVTPMTTNKEPAQESKTPRTDENRFKLSGLDYEARYSGMLANSEAIESALTAMTERVERSEEESRTGWAKNTKSLLQEIEQLRAELSRITAVAKVFEQRIDSVTNRMNISLAARGCQTQVTMEQSIEALMTKLSGEQP